MELSGLPTLVVVESMGPRWNERYSLLSGLKSEVLLQSLVSFCKGSGGHPRINVFMLCVNCVVFDVLKHFAESNRYQDGYYAFDTKTNVYIYQYQLLFSLYPKKSCRYSNI